jgi:nucleoside-diphosphate-sugar epimerase
MKRSASSKRAGSYCEEMAREFNRRNRVPFIGLRFSNIKTPQDYQQFPEFWKDPCVRKWNLWGYVDARDVAQSCRLGLEAGVRGAEVFIVAAADTVMNRSSAKLMEDVFPDVPLKDGIEEFETLLSVEKARNLLSISKV